jgi:hypothetical protein
MTLHFLGPSKFLIQASIPGGPLLPPPNSGPHQFYFFIPSTPLSLSRRSSPPDRPRKRKRTDTARAWACPAVGPVPCGAGSPPPCLTRHRHPPHHRLPTHGRIWIEEEEEEAGATSAGVSSRGCKPSGGRDTTWVGKRARAAADGRAKAPQGARRWRATGGARAFRRRPRTPLPSPARWRELMVRAGAQAQACRLRCHSVQDPVAQTASPPPPSSTRSSLASAFAAERSHATVWIRTNSAAPPAAGGSS